MAPDESATPPLDRRIEATIVDLRIVITRVEEKLNTLLTKSDDQETRLRVTEAWRAEVTGAVRTMSWWLAAVGTLAAIAVAVEGYRALIHG